MKDVGYKQLIVTKTGTFRARMTRIALQHMQLSCIEERLTRVAFVVRAPGTVRVLLPPVRGSLVCSGIRTDDRHIVTYSAGGETVIERLDGPCRWRDIVISSRHLTRYGHVLTGVPIVVPRTVCLWQPPARALRALSALHAGATRVTETHPGEQYNQQAWHGLEQELIDGVVECLSSGPIDVSETLHDRCADIMARFVQSIEAYPDQLPPLTHICRELSVDERTLRGCCHEYLGLGPVRYLRLHRMHRVHRALRSATSGTTTVTQVVRRHGFNEVGRFAGEYRALYGQLPSVTLRRSVEGSTFRVRRPAGILAD